jgi:alpha-tubulin suppressor-like RCC1 family protein
MGKDTFGRGLRAVWATLLLACAGLLSVMASAHAGEGAVPQGQPQVVMLGGGASHSCGLRADGSVLCWGDGRAGQIMVPAGARFAALTTGGNYGCGLRADGSVLCWGAAPPAMPAGTVKFTSISAGASHACGLRADGTALCWGDNRYGQTTVPAGTTFTTLAAALYYTCGLRTDGTALCWGYNNAGQTIAPAGVRFTALTTGGNYACGVRADGSALCWGSNSSGQTTVPAGATFTALAAGLAHTCGLRADGGVLCWGSNGLDQTTVPEGATFTAISVGAAHSCGVLTDGSALCWGADTYGQARAPIFANGEPGYGFGSIAAGSGHGCQRRSDGMLGCWGNNDSGQAPPRMDNFAAVAAGGTHTCALGADGEAECWGADDHGQRSPPPGPFAALELGFWNSCALRFDGAPVCWGWNENGQSAPPLLPDGPRYRSINTGLVHTCAVLDDNSGLCWGYNGDGEAEVPDDETWLAISAGERHSCGLRTNGTLACWGRDNEGEVSTTPSGLFKAVSAGGYHTCAIAVDGVLACWGDGMQGQTMPPEGTFVAVSSGAAHSCAIRSDGVRMCWGDTSTGGNPALTLQPGTLPGMRPAQPYSVQLTLSGSNGYAPLTSAFAIADGDLPPGLTLSASGGLSGWSTATGNYAVTVEGEDDNGFVASRSYMLVVSNDDTSPQIVPTITGTLGENGWYVGNVQLSWSVSDPDSGLISSTGCDPVMLSNDTAGIAFTCSASSGGGTASETRTIKRDATAPTIPAAATTAPNAAGWYRGNVTVAHTCSDALSGVTACPASQLLSDEGSAVSSTAVVVRDAAGNTSAPSNVVTVRIDKTAPTLAPTVTPSRLLLNAVATATANGSDALSGIATQSCVPLVTATVGSKTTTCTTTDAAGNSTSASTGYRVVYGFAGFELPVRNGSFFNGMQNRRAIPFTWRVHDANGADVTTLSSVRIVRNAIACPTGRLESVLPLSSYGSGDPRLRNLGGGRYQRDYSVLAMHGSCAAIGVDLGDGEVHTAKFKIE